MLYVSRLVFSDGVGVADTDDGVETVVNYYDLYHLCCDLGLDIAGVDLMQDSACMQYVKSAHPYQPFDTISVRQAKLKTLYNVDIKVYGSIISSVRWNASAISKPVSVRLSNFGTECADYLLSGNANISEHKVTLVMDDKVSVGPNTFKLQDDDDTFVGKNGMGVMLDLRDVSDFDRARSMYESFYFGSEPELNRSVIDDPNRLKKLRHCL